MGKPLVGAEDLASVAIDTTFSATGVTEWAQFPKNTYFLIAGDFDTNSGAGTIKLECSADGGDTVFSDSDTTFTETFLKRVENPEPGLLWRLNCSAFTSGSIITRISG